MATALVALATTTLAATATTVTFSSISGAYRDLILEVAGNGSGNANLTLQFNGDTGSNYNRVSINGNNVTGATSNTNANVDRLYGAVGGSTALNVQWQILDYSTTNKHKPIIIRSNAFGGEENVVASGGRWASTAAITSIAVFGTTYQIGTVFTLYGVSA